MRDKNNKNKEYKKTRVDFLSRLSIKQKLVFMITLVSSLAMLLAGGAFIANQWVLFRHGMVSDLTTLAKILADNCSSSLAFDDHEDAQSLMNFLNTKDNVSMACIYAKDGENFAGYRQKSFTEPYPLFRDIPIRQGHLFKNGMLVAVEPIKFEEKIIGTIYLRSRLNDLRSFIKKSINMLLLLILLLSIAAFFLSSRLQKVISGPLLHLAGVASRVYADEDYSIRADKQNEDEIGLLTDTFNRMLAQVEKRDMDLRESEEKFRSLYDTSRDAIMIFSPSHGFISGNPSTMDLFGCCNEADFIGKSLSDLSPDYQFETIRSKDKEKIVTRLALEKGSHFFEWKNRRFDGEEFFSEILLNKMQLQDQVVLHATIRNINDRKRDEEELRRLRNLLINIINSMPSVLVGVDGRGQVTHWNSEAERVTGVHADEARGHLLVEVFPQLSVEMDKVKQAIAERKPLHDEKIASEINGETHYSDITVYPLISDGIDGAVIRMDDITDRVRIEEMMIQSEKMLSIGGLAAGMAHEINNPLAGILQNIQVIRNRLREGLQKNETTAQQCDTGIQVIESYVEKRGIFTMIDAIMESGQRASKIVDNMLNFSRKSEADFSAQNIAELLDKTVELASNDYDLKRKYDFRQLRIERDYGKNIPAVFCEASKIQQVFLNVLKNGAQAMWQNRDRQKDPGFMLRVAKEGGMVKIEIEDNGPGISEVVRKRIFEPFFTTKGVGVGTGLGLSVSYFIVTENHGGTMTVESTQGKGSKFIIRLPFERSVT